MPSGLRSYHHSGQPHFLTFSCYRREPRFQSSVAYDLFLACLENMRIKFGTFIYGYGYVGWWRTFGLPLA